MIATSVTARSEAAVITDAAWKNRVPPARRVGAAAEVGDHEEEHDHHGTGVDEDRAAATNSPDASR